VCVRNTREPKGLQMIEAHEIISPYFRELVLHMACEHSNITVRYDDGWKQQPSSGSANLGPVGERIRFYIQQSRTGADSPNGF
jgi:hypothetical protein